jgi:hydroxypyruvate isomerase
MPRFAANLTMLFDEVGFLDRFGAAARAGFRGVEYLFPYQWPVERLREALDRHGLSQVLFNLPAGDWARGERGIACHPARVGEFQDGVGRALDYARALGCPRVNCIAPAAARAEALGETFAENVRFAAAALAPAGVELLVEPINTRDVPGFWLCGTRQALAILDEVGAPNLRLQYDAYHMHIMEGAVARTLEEHLARVGHVQIADHPGRHEPGSGEIDYPSLFALLDRLGYAGWVGCEYRPAAGTEAGLGWFAPWRGRA